MVSSGLTIIARFCTINLRTHKVQKRKECLVQIPSAKYFPSGGHIPKFSKLQSIRGMVNFDGHSVGFNTVRLVRSNKARLFLSKSLSEVMVHILKIIIAVTARRRGQGLHLPDSQNLLLRHSRHLLMLESQGQLSCLLLDSELWT